MPRIARFKIGVIEDLLRQLEYAPEETRLRQMDNAERLIADLDPQQNYPEDFIIFRITGYRSDRSDGTVTLVGQALLPDLVNLVQVLSESLLLEPEELGRTVMTMEQVAQRMQVSSKSIQRYRKLGLVCHYITLPDGFKKLACFEDALERFMKGHAPRLEKAATFSRIEPELEQQMIEQARALRQSSRLSLNEAALLISKEHGRAHETIRMLLRRHDRQSAQPIFADAGPLTDRQIHVLYRGWRRGVEPARMAERFGKTKPTIHRAINRHRAELLKQLQLRWVHLPTFDLPDAEQVILAASAVTTNLIASSQSCDAMALIQMTMAAREDVDVEHALLAGYNMLKKRSAERITALEDAPSTEELDVIETSLRWASLLRKRLIVLSFPAAVRRIEQNVGRPLSALPADQIVGFVKRALEVSGAAIETLDSSRGQRLDRVAGFAMERELAKLQSKTSPPARAAARHAAGSIMIEEAAWMAQPWDAWLSLRTDLCLLVPELPDRDREVVNQRFGLSGNRPLTIAELAEALQARPLGVVRSLQRVARELRALARAKG